MADINQAKQSMHNLIDVIIELNEINDYVLDYTINTFSVTIRAWDVYVCTIDFNNFKNAITSNEIKTLIMDSISSNCTEIIQGKIMHYVYMLRHVSGTKTVKGE